MPTLTAHSSHTNNKTSQSLQPFSLQSQSSQLSVSPQLRALSPRTICSSARSVSVRAMSFLAQSAVFLSRRSESAALSAFVLRAHNPIDLRVRLHAFVARIHQNHFVPLR